MRKGRVVLIEATQVLILLLELDYYSQEGWGGLERVFLFNFQPSHTKDCNMQMYVSQPLARHLKGTAFWPECIWGV